MKDVNVLVVEERPGFASELLAAFRRRAGVRIHGPVAGPRAAAEAHAAGLADVVLVELAPGEPGGVGSIAEIIATIPTVHVLAVTPTPGPETAADALGAGACGLIDRHAEVAALRQAFVQAAAGELVIPDQDLASIIARIDGLRRAACGIDTLTEREVEVLGLLADGWATGEIAQQLGISPTTVQSHVKNVLGKLGVHSKMEAVRLAWREGVARVPASA
jgi:DNA-binding NarL/FixJ family response regulator